MVPFESEMHVTFKRRGQNRTIYTFKNGQPCRMVREPNGVSGQAGILASILKSDIRQVENLHLLVGGVDSCSLQRTASEKGRGRRRSEMP